MFEPAPGNSSFEAAPEERDSLNLLFSDNSVIEMGWAI
jgi:hypothetical protein